MTTTKYYFLLFIIFSICNIIQSQNYQSILRLQGTGYEFLPANPIELIATYTDLSTFMSCYQKCNINPLCRIFVSDINQPSICRLYEGLINTGTIIISSSSTSQVAGLYYDTSFYNSYNQPCDPEIPSFDRYLICINKFWQCSKGTYWNGSMCLNQVYYEESCSMNEACRQDIGLYCSTCGKCLCNSTTYWNSTFCVQSTCSSLVFNDQTLTGLWPLDGNAQDLMNIYNGTLMGNASFVTGYIGQAMKGDVNVCVLLPHIDFYRRSFTIELWFYITNLTNSLMNLFSECDNPILNAECLHYGIANTITLHMGFFADDVRGSTILVDNQWYHVAFVYDYDRRNQLIYLNGLLENLNILDPSAEHIYLGQSGNAAIGGIPIFNNYFFGYIDHVSITYRAKTAKEILDDASLIAYYSFDCGSTFDSSPNLLHGLANKQIIVSGRVNNAFQFNSSNAYFQASGFTALGNSNQSFTISFWIKPLSLTGTLIHLSTQSTGDGWCNTLLGFNQIGQLIAKIGDLIAYSPMLTLNVWTHIVQTYTVNSGIHLFINKLFNTSSTIVHTNNAPNQPVYITIANRLLAGNSCVLTPISNGSFIGSIDELRIYNRQLDTSEICTLYSV